MLRRGIFCLLAFLALLGLASCQSQDPWREDIYYGDSVHVGGNLYVDGVQISPDDHAEVYFATPQSTTVTTPGVFTRVTEFWTSSEMVGFEILESGLLIYRGSRERFFHITATIAISTTAANTTIHEVFYIGGVAHSSGQVQRLLAGSGDVGALAMTSIVSISPGEAIEVYVSTDKACTITTEHMTMCLHSLN